MILDPGLQGVPMADGAAFDVSLSRDSLIARPSNDAAREALGNWN